MVSRMDSLSRGICVRSLMCRGNSQEPSVCSLLYQAYPSRDEDEFQPRHSQRLATRRDDRVAVLRIVLPERSWYDGRACRHGRAQNLRWLEPTRTIFQPSSVPFHPTRVHSGLLPEKRCAFARSFPPTGFLFLSPATADSERAMVETISVYRRSCWNTCAVTSICFCNGNRIVSVSGSRTAVADS